jgi:hypothetical protein
MRGAYDRTQARHARMGCDLLDGGVPRKLLLVRPTGKSEGPEGRPLKRRTEPHPKPLGRENRTSGLGWESSSQTDASAVWQSRAISRSAT